MAITDQLVAGWKLDESSGNAADVLGTYTLTNNNTVAYNTGKINNAADGGSSNTNKCLTRDGNTPAGITYSQFATAWTLSFWVNTTTSGAGAVITGMQVQSGSSQRRNLYILNDSGTLKVKVFDGSSNTYTTSLSMTDGTWYNVIVDYDGSTIHVYGNNSSVLSQSRAFSSQNDSQAGGFGILCERQNNGSFNHLSGKVDEGYVWSRVLSSNERSLVYNSGNANQYPFPLSFSLSESLSLSETLNALRSRLSTTSEALSVSETASALKGISASVSESLSLSEALSSLRGLLSLTIEQSSLSETASVAERWTAASRASSSWSDSSRNLGSWTPLDRT